MREKDIIGLTLQQIQDKFTLPATPVYVTDVNIPAGTHLQTGVVNSVDGWGGGGEIQLNLMGNRVGEFTNERMIEKVLD